MADTTARVLEALFAGVSAGDPVARCLVLVDGAPVALSATPAAWSGLSARERCLVSIADALVDGPGCYPTVTVATARDVLTGDEMERVARALNLA